MDVPVRTRISDYHSYLSLVLGLEPRSAGMRNSEIREVMNATSDFLRGASANDLAKRGRQIESLLQRVVEISRPRHQPRRDPLLIGREFRLIAAQSEDIWRYGIPYGWLAENFTTPSHVLPFALPAHARVGLGHHSGYISVEEGQLLKDMFVLLELARGASRRMSGLSNTIAEPTSIDEAHATHRRLTAVNMNLATYSRLGVVSAAAFVETFVNSVGATEASAPGRSREDGEILNGSKKGRFLGLEFKLEHFPAIIRDDRKAPIVLSDEKQLREPFRRFLSETKGIRDASVHFAPSKASILCTPMEWLDRVEHAVNDALAVAKEFWKACYPARGFPEYLDHLDGDRLTQDAIERLSLDVDVE